MSIAALAAVLGFATFALLSIVAALISAFVTPRRHPSAPAHARRLFLHAVAPTVVPAAVVAALLVPSFLIHEAPRADEWPGASLVLLACAGALRLAWIAARAVRTLRASQALVQAWMANAEPLPAEPWGVRASKIDAGFPVVAAAGMLRPHVFVDRRVIDACSPAELAAVAAHERAHISSRDNLRRFVIAACTGHDSAAASAWRIAAERAADERASDSPCTAAELASALVRVARIAPAPTLPLAAISTIHDGGSLEQRVRHLLHFAPSGRTLESRTTPMLVAVSAAAAGLMVMTPLPKSLHAVLELLVQAVP
jgi:hypothetical protein